MSARARIQTTARIVKEIVRKEFAQIRQDRRMIGLSLGAPLLQVLLLGYAATTDIRYSTMAVCDLDRSPESREFVREFSSSGYFVPGAVLESVSEVDREIESGDAAAALVLPAGFGRDILARRRPQVQMIFDGADANNANILAAYANQIVISYSQELLASYAMSGSSGRTALVIPEPRIWFNPDLRSSHFMVPGVVALVLMIITMTLTSLAIVKEKEAGTLEQLMVTPVTPFQLVLGKLIPFVIIGFADVLLVLGIARFWFEVPMRGSILLLFSLSGLFILTTLGLGLFVSTIARSQQQAMLIAQFFFFMPFIFLSGFTFPIANMPTLIQYSTLLIPLRYFMEILRGIFLRGAGIAELWPQAAALLAIGTVIFTLSVLRFRKTLE